MAAETARAVAPTEMDRLLEAAAMKGIRVMQFEALQQGPELAPVSAHALHVPAPNGNHGDAPTSYHGGGSTANPIIEESILRLNIFAWLYHMSIMWSPHLLMMLSPVHVIIMFSLLAAERGSDSAACRAINAVLPLVVVTLYVCFVMSRSYRLKYGGKNMGNYMRMALAFSVLFNIVLGYAWVYYSARSDIRGGVRDDPSNPYWFVHLSWTTLSTVGFGDMTPGTVEVALYTNMEMFSYFYFVVFGAVADAASYWSENSLYTHEKMRATLNGEWASEYRSKRRALSQQKSEMPAPRPGYAHPSYPYGTAPQAMPQP
jgi:prepilin signal peptidase PulO-like enzyme (type II secretory pathway)